MIGPTDVANVIEAELPKIILVGHNFGRGPVSVVADRMPEGVIKHWLFRSGSRGNEFHKCRLEFPPAVFPNRNSNPNSKPE